MRALYSVKEFAELAGVATSTAYDWVAADEIEHVRINGRVRIPARVVNALTGEGSAA